MLSLSFSADAVVDLDLIESKPPALPAEAVYTANYCEENIYLLVKKFLEDEGVSRKWSPYAVFISNNTRAVALWSQKLREDVVVWDYHVILALVLKRRADSSSAGRHPQSQDQSSDPTERGSTWVYDLDTRLDVPCSWSEYVDRTFPYSTSEAVAVGWSVPSQFQSLFRIVEGREFLENFASDRSHMLVPDSDPPQYEAPPPPYPCIVGASAAARGEANNLMRYFVCMDVAKEREIGRVYTVEEAKQFFA